MKRLQALIVCICTLALLTTTTTNAHAEDKSFADNLMQLCIFAASTSSTTSFFFDVGASTTNIANSMARANRYVDHNQHALAQDITLGGGESLWEVATLYRLNISDRRAFGKHVRTQRKALIRAMTRRDHLGFYKILKHEKRS